MAPADRVLITAATSGIALVGAQIARVVGAATVIGTTRRAAQEDLLRQVGADHVVVTGGGDADLAEQVRQVTDGAGADVVLDHIGGASLAAAVDATRAGGAVISVGRLAGATAEIDLFRLAAAQVTLQSVSFGFDPAEVIGDLLDGVAADVLDAVADRRVRAIVDSTFAFTNAAAAITRLRTGDAAGKVVLTLT